MTGIGVANSMIPSASSCAVILVVTTEAAFSPFVLAAASPLVMVALSDRRLLAALTLPAVVAIPVAMLADPGRGIPAMLHATAVVLAVPWLAYAVRLSASASRIPFELALVVTEADRILLSQLELGLTQAQIAERSGVSLETIKVRVARLYRHLGAANKQEAIRLARLSQAPRLEGDIPERRDKT